MTNNKYDKLLIEALILYKSRQLEAIPSEDEIDYEFSSDFKKKAEKLIRKQNRSVWRFFQGISRRAAAIIIAIILGLTATLSIDAVREPIFEFFYRVFSTHTDIEYSGDSSKTITDYYTLPKVPNGYEQTSDTFNNEYSSSIFWANSTGDQISLQQFVSNTSSSINTEDSVVKELSVDGVNTLVCNNGHSFICTWSDHRYYFELIYPSELEENFMYEVIGKLVAAENLNQSELNQQSE